MVRDGAYVHAHAVADVEVLVHGQRLDGSEHEHGRRQPESIVEGFGIVLPPAPVPSAVNEE
jgi:hypothetical protein